MVQQLKLIISENGEIIESIVKETDTDSTVLYKSLEEFEILANTALTKLVEKSGNADMDEYIEEYTSSDEDEEKVCSNAKQRKKKKMNL